MDENAPYWESESWQARSKRTKEEEAKINKQNKQNFRYAVRFKQHRIACSHRDHLVGSDRTHPSGVQAKKKWRNANSTSDILDAVSKPRFGKGKSKAEDAQPTRQRPRVNIDALVTAYRATAGLRPKSPQKVLPEIEAPVEAAHWKNRTKHERTKPSLVESSQDGSNDGHTTQHHLEFKEPRFNPSLRGDMGCTKSNRPALEARLSAEAAQECDDRVRKFSLRANQTGLTRLKVNSTSAGFVDLPDFKIVQASNFRLNPAGAVRMLQQMAPDVVAVNLANNRIGTLGCEQLAKQLRLKDCALSELDVSDNSLPPEALQILTEALLANKSVHSLKLESSTMRAKECESMANLITHSKSIANLDLKASYVHEPWTLMTSMMQNTSLRTLDLSSCALGSLESKGGWRRQISALKPADATLAALCEYLRTNKTLTYLNLNYNRFSIEESQQLGTALAPNKTLIGLHMLGNCCTVDSKMFIVPVDGICQTDVSAHVRDQGSLLQVRNHDLLQQMHDDNVSWLNDGWTEVRFEWKVGISGPAKGADICIHLSVDGWKADLMKKHPVQENYSDTRFLYRMVPPGRTWYYFTEWGTGEPFVGKEQHIEGVAEYANHSIHHTHHFLGRAVSPNQGCNYVDATSDPRVPKNPGQSNFMPLDIVEAKPRVGWYNPEGEHKPTQEKFEPQWMLTNSMFALRPRENDCDWFFDTAEVYAAAFERDYSYSKIASLMPSKEEEANTKELLCDMYPNLVALFRYHACRGIGVDPYTIGRLGFSDMCQSCKIMDGRRVRVLECESVFTVVNMGETNDDVAAKNSVHTLERFEFVEAVVRLGIAKYSHVTDSVHEAVLMILENNVEPRVHSLEYKSVGHCLDTCLFRENDLYTVCSVSP
jgi:hypothetical protein